MTGAGAAVPGAWVTGLSSGPHNATASHRVAVVASQAHDYVVITEGSALEDLVQPSITNAVEYHCAQIAYRLGLEWSRCRFIEHCPANGEPGRLDPIYDRIVFADAAPVEDMIHGGLRATLARPTWRMLSLPLALALQDAGLRMSQFIGHIGVFERIRDGARIRQPIHAYDGRRYYDAQGRAIQGLLHHVEYHDTGTRIFAST